MRLVLIVANERKKYIHFLYGILYSAPTDCEFNTNIFHTNDLVKCLEAFIEITNVIARLYSVL